MFIKIFLLYSTDIHFSNMSFGADETIYINLINKKYKTMVIALLEANVINKKSSDNFNYSGSEDIDH